MNMRSLLLSLLTGLLLTTPNSGDEIGQRPYEMVWADRVSDSRTPLIDFENLDDWTVSQQEAECEFSISQKHPLWGDHIGELVYRGTGTSPIITIRPPEPVPVQGPFDCVNLWVYGNNWGWAPDPLTPMVEIRVLLQSASGTTVPLVLGRVRWKEWWLMHLRLSAEQKTQLGEQPSFVGLEVHNGRNKEDRAIYFDNLAIYTEQLEPLRFEPRRQRGIALPAGQTVGNNIGPGRLPFPTRDETILPDNLATQFDVSLERSGDAYQFQYTGDDGTLIYRYCPTTGTLSDVTAQWVGRGEAFRPLDGGKVLFTTSEGENPPSTESLTLVRCECEQNLVRSIWQGKAGDETTEVTYTLRLWQKSLVIDVQCEGGVVSEFRVGQVVGAPQPRLVTLPYLVGAEQRPAILIAGPAEQPLFLSALLDHCRSNSSLFWFFNRVADEEATINGGSRYLPKTDGTRNSCYERLFLTVSPQFEEVLPDIPNPRSPWMHVTGSRVWYAYGASDRERDYEHWKQIARYGMTQIALTDHETGWRDGGESFTMRTRAAPGKGGDQGQVDYARKIRALGFRYGIYNNYTDYAPVNEHWDEDYVTRTPDNQWQTAWPRCYNPKPARAVELESRLAPIIQQKFQLDTAYCDVHTAVQPWSYVDYDARVPGAGTFAATFFAYGEIMLHQKETWNGPVYSEGNNHWYYCGLTDGNYGQDQGGQLATNPWLVDFDLRKMHPLCCNFGMGNPDMFFGNQNKAGHALAEREARVDRFLAATLAFGHTGFLVFDIGIPSAIQSYYCLQQVQTRYAQQEVESIRYADESGQLLETSLAVAADVHRRSQVATRYDNGLEVYVNGHETDNWSLPQTELPPNGWYVCDSIDHQLTAFSALVDGHRADYVDSPAYVYANGRGILTRFPRATCDGQLIANWRPDGTVEVIPVSGCRVAGIELHGQSATAVALDEAGTSLGPATLRTSRGLVYITLQKEAFSYLLTLTPAPADALKCERVNVLPGETVQVSGTTATELHIPDEAEIGTQVWLESEGRWIDFTATSLVHATLSLEESIYRLTLQPRTQWSMPAEARLGSQTLPFALCPDQTVELEFAREIPDQETVQELPLDVTAGPLAFAKTWWSITQYDSLVLATPSDDVETGQRIRGEPERSLDGKTGAGVYWTDRSCGDEPKRCLFMHPPYQGGVGYSFALLQPIALGGIDATFRCEIGKADGSDAGDGILFQIAVLDEQGTETVVNRKQWTQHAWGPLEADLSPWKGRPITLKLIADAGTADNSTGDWACWTNMRLESTQRQLVTSISSQKVELDRQEGPYPTADVTCDEVREARRGVLHFQGIGLEHGAPYISTVSLNGVVVGELPAAGGDEQQGIWGDASMELTPAAIASLRQWNVVEVRNPGKDSFKIGRIWIELTLSDGRQMSSQITRTVFTQPATWAHAEGTGVPFEKNIESTVRIPLSHSPQ